MSMTETCMHCGEPIEFVTSSIPQLGGDWFHVDETGATISMTCNVVNSYRSSTFDFAEPANSEENE